MRYHLDSQCAPLSFIHEPLPQQGQGMRQAKIVLVHVIIVFVSAWIQWIL